jgi:hypothetical protein
MTLGVLAPYRGLGIGEFPPSDPLLQLFEAINLFSMMFVMPRKSDMCASSLISIDMW